MCRVILTLGDHPPIRFKNLASNIGKSPKIFLTKSERYLIGLIIIQILDDSP